MDNHLDRALRTVPLLLGVLTLAGVVALFAWDIFPASFPARAHDFLGAFPLAMIAIAYLVYQGVQRVTPLRQRGREWAKAVLLAAAFFFWAANQLWPDVREATLFNDIAIGLFVLDIFLVIAGWPAPSNS